MGLRIWRWLTFMLIALGMSAAMAHLLEMPAKLGYDGALWLRLLQTLYPPAFGPVAGSLEAGGVLAVVVLAFLVRRRGPALLWTLVAAVCMVAAHAAFWLWVSPVNAALLPLTPETLPADWSRLRDQWEYTHAARALLQVVAAGALAWSYLVETPRSADRAGAHGQTHPAARHG
jgi:mRNA-degrading endonuclease toxin of MazEF toxin-antitoxin module